MSVTLGETTAGYSKKSLVDKLGIKAGHKICFANAPKNYGDTLGQLPPDVWVEQNPAADLDFVQYFTKSQAEVEAQFPALKQAIAQTGMLWICWPKKTTKIETDVSGAVVREIGLANGLVDVKICAVDETWLGLKFVYRVKDRRK